MFNQMQPLGPNVEPGWCQTKLKLKIKELFHLILELTQFNDIIKYGRPKINFVFEQIPHAGDRLNLHQIS